MPIANQKKTVMDDSLFRGIVLRLELQTGEDTERVGMDAGLNGFFISIYADEYDDYRQLVVEEFGQLLEGKWVQYDPTMLQLKILKNRLLKEVDKIFYEKEQVNQLNGTEDTGWEETKDFINSNFYRIY